MPRGGKRAGAGKPPGTVNKMSSLRAERLIEEGKRLPPEDLLLLAQLLTQQKNRAGQSPEPLTSAEVRAVWEKLRATALS